VVTLFRDLVLPYGRVLYDYKKAKPSEFPVTPGQPTAETVLNASAMPIISPSYVGKNFRGNFSYFLGSPSKLSNREYLIITYKSTTEAVR
jgi:acetoacetate decarboxylase